MSFFKKQLGIEEIKLSKTEKAELNLKMIRQDQQRTEFFAVISLFFCSVFILLDLANFYDEHQVFYFILDLSLFVVSLLILILKFFTTKPKINPVRKIFLSLFPYIGVVWATAIATLPPLSILNMFTFYIVFFIFIFFITSNIVSYIAYNLTYIFTFLITSHILKQSMLSETFFLLLMGGFVSFPFYFTYRITRINSMAAMVKTNKSNLMLEHKVERKMRQLNLINEELNNEIAQRKVVEAKLRDALKKAETSDQLKSEFLANISHEIRTPLNAIIGFTEMLTEDGVSKEQKTEFQKLVASNTMFLLSTIDDIFDASLVNKHQINIIQAPFKVNRFLESVFYDTAGIVLKYGNNPNIDFVTVKLSDDKIILNTDEYFLKKAMLRLIDNAFKFTLSGSVEVGARMGTNGLQLYVKDTGISICEADKEKIFEPFVQGDGSFTRDFGGAGLGLSIVKGIVKEMKCHFHMESQKGVGSTFSMLFEPAFLEA